MKVISPEKMSLKETANKYTVKPFRAMYSKRFPYTEPIHIADKTFLEGGMRYGY